MEYLTLEQQEEQAQIEIKNKALFHIGYSNYESADQDTKDKVDRVYEATLIKCLSIYNWGFATEIKKITSEIVNDGDETNDGLLYKYTNKMLCPSDFVRMLNIYTDKKLGHVIFDYFLKKDIIYCNEKEIFLKYIRRVESYNLPVLFKEFFEYEIAVSLLFNLTGNSSDLQSLLNQYKLERYNQAKQLDTKQKRNFKIRSNPYLDCRR